MVVAPMAKGADLIQKGIADLIQKGAAVAAAEFLNHPSIPSLPGFFPADIESLYQFESEKGFEDELANWMKSDQSYKHFCANPVKQNSKNPLELVNRQAVG